MWAAWRTFRRSDLVKTRADREVWSCRECPDCQACSRVSFRSRTGGSPPSGPTSLGERLNGTTGRPTRKRHSRNASAAHNETDTGTHRIVENKSKTNLVRKGTWRVDQHTRLRDLQLRLDAQYLAAASAVRSARSACESRFGARLLRVRARRAALASRAMVWQTKLIGEELVFSPSPWKGPWHTHTHTRPSKSSTHT